MNHSVMIVAGEASGDLHGGKLVRAMRKKAPDLPIWGIGGITMKDAGVEIIMDASELAVVGITEVISKFGNVFKAMSAAKRALTSRRPALLILIDYPEFNLHLAKFAREKGVPVLYYIRPQIWAWRSGRVRIIRERVNHMAVILPFEQNFYRKHGVSVTFAGHPLMDKSLSEPSPDFEARFEKTPVVALLPGSRDGEVHKLLPVMLEAAEVLRHRHGHIRFIASRSPSVDPSLFDDIFRKYGGNADIEVMSAPIDTILERCSFAVVASGTATLETAIAGIPLAVIYKVSPLSYILGRALIRVPHISLVNLIAGTRLVPELIQHDVTPRNIADTVSSMLADIPGLKRLSRDLFRIRHLLGSPGASERVAKIALKMLNDKC